MLSPSEYLATEFLSTEDCLLKEEAVLLAGALLKDPLKELADDFGRRRCVELAVKSVVSLALMNWLVNNRNWKKVIHKIFKKQKYDHCH